MCDVGRAVSSLAAPLVGAVTGLIGGKPASAPAAAPKATPADPVVASANYEAQAKADRIKLEQEATAKDNQDILATARRKRMQAGRSSSILATGADAPQASTVLGSGGAG